jgi:hypothetical protein
MSAVAAKLRAHNIRVTTLDASVRVQGEQFDRVEPASHDAEVGEPRVVAGVRRLPRRLLPRTTAARAVRAP